MLTGSFRRRGLILGYESGQFDAATSDSCSNGTSARNIAFNSSIHHNGTDEPIRSTRVNARMLRDTHPMSFFNLETKLMQLYKLIGLKLMQKMLFNDFVFFSFFNIILLFDRNVNNSLELIKLAGENYVYSICYIFFN